MIRVTIERAADRSIRSFVIDGHALFADHGQDIVCAGVSAVTFGTLNAIEKLMQLKLKVRTGDGLVKATVPNGLTERQHNDVQLLLSSMLVMLESIEQSYGSHITIHDR